MSSQGEATQPLSQSQRIVWGISLSGFLTLGWLWSGIDLPEQLQSVGVNVTSREPAAVVRDAKAKFRAGSSGDKALFEVCNASIIAAGCAVAAYCTAMAQSFFGQCLFHHTNALL
jgi:hypothetical protein